MADQVVPVPSPEQSLGLDTQRVWATGVQVFVNSDFSILVFKEQATLAFEDVSLGPPRAISKNVVSVVLPTPVLRELTNILQNQLKSADDAAGE